MIRLPLGDSAIVGCTNSHCQSSLCQRAWVDSQGQRPLTLCAGKDLCHEIEIPAATSAFHDDAFFAGMLLEQR
jgi:hypothetical protein